MGTITNDDEEPVDPPADPLGVLDTDIYRFQNTAIPGTYLFASQEERESINTNFSEDFNEEGLAFYVYGADSGIGTTFYRFQNENRPGTYLFVGPDEREDILANFPNFIEEGPAFNASTEF